MTWPVTSEVGGRAYGQHVVEPFPHLRQPGACLCDFLMKLSPLLSWGRIDLQTGWAEDGRGALGFEVSK